MKIARKILIILVVIIGSVISVLKNDYIRITVSYFFNQNNYVEVFDVQGNTNKYVPQGMAYSDMYDVVLQTSYNSNHEVSMLYITDFKTGSLLKSLRLIETDGSNNVNHVGGIATDNVTVWITNDYEVNEYSLEKILNTNQDYIQSQKNTKLHIRGDFCYYKDNTLWIGDFFLNPFYPVPDNSPILLSYNTGAGLDYSSPDCAILLPKMVQGMTITPDNKFVFTSSFTNLIYSDLRVYNNVLEEQPEKYCFYGRDIPYYKFSKSNLEKCIKLPPMAEGLFNIGNDLYILFENSSDKYFYAVPKMKKVIKYSL